MFTLFPDLVAPWTAASLIGKAARAGLLDLRVHDLRAGTTDPHRSVDDSPFGGGAGMVLAPEPVFAAVEAVGPPRPLLLLGPGGRRFDQAWAAELAAAAGLLAAVRPLRGGRPAGRRPPGRRRAVARRLRAGRRRGGRHGGHRGGGPPGPRRHGQRRVGPSTRASRPACSSIPQYTRPAVFRGWAVPEVLRSGDHARVARWRRAQALARTLARRPDLIEARGGLTEEERALLAEFGLGALS